MTGSYNLLCCYLAFTLQIYSFSLSFLILIFFFFPKHCKVFLLVRTVCYRCSGISKAEKAQSYESSYCTQRQSKGNIDPSHPKASFPLGAHVHIGTFWICSMTFFQSCFCHNHTALPNILAITTDFLFDGKNYRCLVKKSRGLLKQSILKI